jgi:hypothetical protein
VCSESGPLAGFSTPSGRHGKSPLLHRLLSPEYRHKSVEEGTLVLERTAEKNINKALDDLLGYKQTNGSI